MTARDSSVKVQAMGTLAFVRRHSTLIAFTVSLGASVVFVRTKDGFEAVPVVLGDRAGANVIVRSGLKGTEQIAITNSFSLKAEIGKGEAGDED